MDLRKIRTVLIVLGAALVLGWVLIDRLPVSELTRARLRSILVRATALAVGAAAAGAALLSAPWWAAASVAAVAFVAAGGWDVLRAAGVPLPALRRTGSSEGPGECPPGVICLGLEVKNGGRR